MLYLLFYYNEEAIRIVLVIFHSPILSPGVGSGSGNRDSELNPVL